MRRLLISIVVLTCVAAVALSADVHRFLTTAMTPDHDVVVTIDPGMSWKAVVRRLAAEGLISNPRDRVYLSVYARQQKMARHVESGEYRVPPLRTPAQLLTLLTSGKTIHYRITLVDGWTFKQMQAAIDNNDVLEHTLKGDSAADIMQALGHGDDMAEGRFLPDTYFFPRGATDLSIYKRAFRAMQTQLKQAWADRADNIAVKTPYQALILASIIERETGIPDERRRVSGVFTRRLKRGMRLQTDASVIYGIQNFDGNITRKDLRADTPYNTYVHAGLPPTPIAMPSRASIHAALHPEKGKALYFVAKGDGTHKFSATLAEHNRAVRKYQLR